jgi:hypothetical protein
MTGAERPASPHQGAGKGKVQNLGEPIRLADVKISGFSLTSARQNELVKVATRMSLTSEDAIFHKLMEGLASMLAHHTQQLGILVDIGRANLVLLVIRPDLNAELWVDTAAASIRCMAKGPVKAGQAVFDRDIADVTGMEFPGVSIGTDDQILCVLRQDWRFGVFFDFNPTKNLSIDDVTSQLGTLYRNLKYRHLYDSLANEAVVERLAAAGWFPFVEIVPSEFRRLAAASEEGWDLAEPGAELVKAFDADRLKRIQERWMTRPHFASKASILEPAIQGFLRREPVPVLKILLTEIEGVLALAFAAKHARQPKNLEELLTFSTDTAAAKSGGSDTLLFSAAFAKYLRTCTFANFDPTAGLISAGSRHAISHGAAGAETYTMERALQAILTLDQLAFYT